MALYGWSVVGKFQQAGIVGELLDHLLWAIIGQLCIIKLATPVLQLLQPLARGGASSNSLSHDCLYRQPDVVEFLDGHSFLTL